MDYPPRPKESKEQINKAGKILINDLLLTQEYTQARDLVNRFRACHSYPMNTFNAGIRKKIKESFPKSTFIVAQRLKRMPSIVDKLKRNPTMNLSRIQDIGGLRVILRDLKNVYDFINEYKQCKFDHKLLHEIDYISTPKESGYRSIHLIYEYINDTEYDGLNLELQVRTEIQHIWATAVETVGLFINNDLKSGIGDKNWLNFFKLISEAFTYFEMKYNSENRFDLPIVLKKEIIKIEKEFNALNKMEGISIVHNAISTKLKNSQKATYNYWSLVKLDTIKKKIKIQYFKKKDIHFANNMYERFEKEALNNNSFVSVLVSTGNIKILEQAYPNLFYDIKKFVLITKKLISSPEIKNKRQ